MSGETTARPWKGNPNRFMVYVAIKWADGTKTVDRTVITAKTETAALRWGDARRANLVSQGPPSGRRAQLSSAVPTFAAFAAEWLRTLRGDPKKKPSAVDAIESTLRIHLLPFIGDKPLDKITDEVVDALTSRWTQGGYEYIGQHGHAQVAEGTRNQKTHANRRTVLRSCLACAVRYKRIPGMPATIEVRQVKAAEADHYDHATYESIVAAAAELDPRILVATLLGGDAGLRRGEIIGLTLEDVDSRTGRIRVRHNVYWAKKICTDVTPKGGTEEPVPCTPRLLAALRAVRHLRGGRLLQTDDGKPLTPPMLRRWIMRAEEKAGLPKTGRLHVYRHTFCSRLAQAGVPARTIQKLARHTDLSTTQRYMHLSPNATEQGIDMLEQFRAQGGVPVIYGRTPPSK